MTKSYLLILVLAIAPLFAGPKSFEKTILENSVYRSALQSVEYRYGLSCSKKPDEISEYGVDYAAETTLLATVYCRDRSIGQVKKVLEFSLLFKNSKLSTVDFHELD